MPTLEDLRRALHRIDGRGYKAYKDLQGWYRGRGGTLYLDHIQGDPFATPSLVRLRIPQDIAHMPPSLFDTRVRRIALQDFLARTVHHAIRHYAKGQRGMGTSGVIRIDAGGQEVLERTAVVVTPAWVEARLQVGLPAAGRSILGKQAETMLCDELPRIGEQGLHWAHLPQDEGQAFVRCVENYERIQEQLEALGLLAFVADGAILPRESGASERPLPASRTIPFQAPDSLRVSVELAHPVPGTQGPVGHLSGMGIPRGVTLIVGGGYHGKSTLLRALERGVYPHVPGDGREYVVTGRDAVKIRAEDGRRIEHVDISPFIATLPYGGTTTAFSTDNASGSTSQAANIVEALEVGASGLLLDEDTSATNFMVRDARMQALVRKQDEPITPFVDRVRELYDRQGISTVLVMGGCGDYFDTADTVILLRDFLPVDVTADAKRIAREADTHRQVETAAPMAVPAARIPLAQSLDPSRGRRAVKIDAKAVDLLVFGSDSIDLSGVEQLVDLSQTRAVGYAIHHVTESFVNGKTTLREAVEEMDRVFDRHAIDLLNPFSRDGEHPGNFARPRKHEIAAAINRLRSVQMSQRR